MYGILAAELARVPATVVAAHDMGLVSLGKRVLPRWAVASLRVADALVLLSELQREYLHTEEGVGRHWWSTVREAIITNGVVIRAAPEEVDRVTAREVLGLAPDEFVVGAIARLADQKAHHVLLRAMARLKQDHARCRLVLVGDGERRRELEQLASDLGISDLVLFAGERRDVPDLLAGFDVSSLSSVHEAMPLSVIESMAACLPVVATDCGALRDLVVDGETGYLVPVGDVAALADRLVVLADHPALRVRLGKNARALAEQNFTIERTALAYEELLFELVAGKDPRP
jgi:glycosyltransferase involved in cell wall biosynthesis